MGLETVYTAKLIGDNIGFDFVRSRNLKQYGVQYFDWWYGNIYYKSKTRVWYDIDLSDTGASLNAGVDYIKYEWFWESWGWNVGHYGIVGNDRVLETDKLSFTVDCKCGEDDEPIIEVSADGDKLVKEIGGHSGELLSAGVGYKVLSTDDGVAKIEMSAASGAGYQVQFSTNTQYNMSLSVDGVGLSGGESAQQSWVNNYGAKIERGPVIRRWKCVEVDSEGE